MFVGRERWESKIKAYIQQHSLYEWVQTILIWRAKYTICSQSTLSTLVTISERVTPLDKALCPTCGSWPLFLSVTASLWAEQVIIAILSIRHTIHWHDTLYHTKSRVPKTVANLSSRLKLIILELCRQPMKPKTGNGSFQYPNWLFIWKSMLGFWHSINGHPCHTEYHKEAVSSVDASYIFKITTRTHIQLQFHTHQEKLFSNLVWSLWHAFGLWIKLLPNKNTSATYFKQQTLAQEYCHLGRQNHYLLSIEQIPHQ